MKDIFKALEFLHKQGHVHNDIKPDNIMLDSDLNATIIDLGFISKFLMPDKKHIDPSLVKAFQGNIVYSSYH